MFNKNPHYTIIDKCLIKHVGGMVFNAIFNNILVISCLHGNQFYWWRKQEYQEKTTDLAYEWNALVTHIFLSCVMIYENVDIVFIEIYCIH
jgi:hypothetical protein